MGADIHSFAEVRTNGRWLMVEKPLFGNGTTLSPFDWRSYAMFGFLADVRNYSCCVPICKPKGLPTDSVWLNSPSKYSYDINPLSGESIPENERETNKKGILEGYYHSMSWLTLKELLDYDYEQTFWDRRVSKQVSANGWNGAALAGEGEGRIITYREHLGLNFFDDVDVLKTLGNPEDVRVIFWFDN